MTSDEKIRDILTGYNTVAVYGMSGNKEKSAHTAPGYLLSRKYNIIPINPRVDRILGRKSHPTLADVPDGIEVLDVFRPSREALDVVKQAVERHRERGDIDVIWLQEGIVNEGARKLAEAEGIVFVQDRCMAKEHMRLFPEGVAHS